MKLLIRRDAFSLQTSEDLTFAFWTQLQNYGLVCLEPTEGIGLFLPWPVTLVSLLSSSSQVPPLSGGSPAACVPCAALPAVRRGMDPGRLTAGSPAVPRDQQSFAVLCLTATVAATVDTDRLFWTEIPASLCQTKQTLP